jgi:hypothetical protein
MKDPGPSLFTGLPTRWLLGSPGVLGRAHYHPLEAHLLCAVGQQGTESNLGRFCTLMSLSNVSSLCRFPRTNLVKLSEKGLE